MKCPDGLPNAIEEARLPLRLSCLTISLHELFSIVEAVAVKTAG